MEVPWRINCKNYLPALFAPPLLRKTSTSAINSFANVNHSIGPQCQSQLLVLILLRQFSCDVIFESDNQPLEKTATYHSIGTCGCFSGRKVLLGFQF